MPHRPHRFVIYALTVSMSVICYIDRAALSAGMPAIAREFSLSPAQIGWVLSSFLWSYALLNLPGAMALDRFGARRVGAAAVAFWSISMALGGAAPALASFIVTRVALGAGEAPTFAMGNKIVRAWAPERERGQVLTALICGVPAGLAVGSAAGAWLIAHYGWRVAFAALGAVGLVWSLAWWRLYPVDIDAPGGQTRMRISVGATFRQRSFWGIVIGQCCANYANYLLMSWLPLMLRHVLGLGLVAAGSWTAVCYLAATILALALGRLGESFVAGRSLVRGARRFVAAGFFLVACLMGCVPLCTSLLSLVTLLAVSLAFLMAGIGAQLALHADLIEEPQLVASATGLALTFSNLTGIAAPVIAGYLLEATGNFNTVFEMTTALLLTGIVAVLVLPTRSYSPSGGRPVHLRTPVGRC